MQTAVFMVILYDVLGKNIEYQKRNILGVIVKKERGGINVL